MPIADELIKAIKNAVVDQEQPDEVGQRIHAWLDNLSNSSLDMDSNFQHLEAVYRAIQINSSEGLDEN